jgi:hypothetical protein
MNTNVYKRFDPRVMEREERMESTVGYRRLHMYECSLSWLGTDASIKADGVKLVYGVKPPLLVK